MAKLRTTSFINMPIKVIISFLRSGGGAGIFRINGQNKAGIQISKERVLISYAFTLDGEEHSIDESVRLEWTPCHYGGERPWFSCPRCGKRCGVLYLGHFIACRRCFRMIYPCQADRHYRGWMLYWRWRMESKPKGMHWCTYNRIKDKAERKCMGMLLPVVESLERRMNHCKK
jgi:hypothetical protein